MVSYPWLELGHPYSNLSMDGLGLGGGWAGAGPSVLKFEYGWAGLGLGWAGAGAPYSNLSTVELGQGWAGAMAPYSNLNTVELGLGWAGAELGFGLNGFHIEG